MCMGSYGCTVFFLVSWFLEWFCGALQLLYMLLLMFFSVVLPCFHACCFFLVAFCPGFPKGFMTLFSRGFTGFMIF